MPASLLVTLLLVSLSLSRPVASHAGQAAERETAERETAAPSARPASPRPVSARPVSARPAVVARFATLPNLTWQLDCVSGITAACGAADFRALWSRRFLRRAADSAALTRWRTTRERYAQALAFDDRAPRPPLFARGNRLDVDERLRVAGLRAHDVADYAAALDLLTRPTDRATLLGVVHHFLPRFSQWMTAEARPRGAAFARATTEWLRRTGAGAVAQLAHFYEAAGPDTVTFVLLYRPALAPDASYGQAVDRFALVEFLAGERPSDRLPIAVHELCHVLSLRTPDDTFVRVQRDFLALPAADATAAYALLEEGLASALGSARTERALRGDRAFSRLLATRGALYNVEVVERAGRALLPLVDRWLAEGRTIGDPGFSAAAHAALRGAFGEALGAPAVALRTMALFTDEAFGADTAALLRREARQLLDAGTSFAAQDRCCDVVRPLLTEHPALPGLLLVTPASVPGLVTAGVLTAADAPAGAGVVVARPTWRRAPVWIVVADAYAGARAALVSLARVPATPSPDH